MDLLKNKEMQLEMNYLELLPTSTILTFISMENSPLIFNKQEPVVTIPLLLLTVKLSTGEEMIQSKKEPPLEELIMDGLAQITLTGF